MSRYENATKAHWRDWCWNYIEKNSSTTRKHAKCLYLPGDTTRDMEQAVSRGFTASNLTAVDRCPSAVKKARQRKLNVVRGDVYDVIVELELSQCRPFNAVVLDFCAGIQKNTRWPGLAAESITEQGSPIILNFQRGRDQVNSQFRLKNKLPHKMVHRGEIYWRMREWALGHGIRSGATDTAAVESMINPNPRFFSYRANNVWMDSVAYCTRGENRSIMNLMLEKRHLEREESRLMALSRDEARLFGGDWSKDNERQFRKSKRRVAEHDRIRKSVIAVRAVQSKRGASV